MRRAHLAALAFLILLAAGVGGYFYFQDRLRVTSTGPATPFEIPSGLRARQIVHLLKEKGVIGDENVALAYVVASGNRGRLKAGEYLFDTPLTIRDVIDRIAAGKVYLRRFTVPEGLTVRETALAWAEQGFGTAEEFLAAVAESGDLARELGVEGLEGYLFPETYSFPSRTSAREAVEAMVSRFQEVFAQLSQELATEQWPLNPRQTVILASLVEAEAAVDDERVLVASVFLNRLKIRMPMQCDPTVIYALERENRYRGRLTFADLRFDSPYNTYRYPGLPPGPITNPGALSLQAAIRPATSPYLYFVRTTEGRHTFSENLAKHNRAVAAYRAMTRGK